MSEATKTIERVTGISEADQVEILEQVKANLKTLASCPFHDFSIPIDRHSKQPTEKPIFACKWRCSKCGGEVDGSAKNWFERGVKAAQEAMRR